MEIRQVLRYVVQQVLWLLSETALLIATMGVGVKWIFMTVRVVSFAMFDLIYFIPPVIWYVLSPTIIRRVAYRSSRKTKLRNMEILLDRFEKRMEEEEEKEKDTEAAARGRAKSLPTGLNNNNSSFSVNMEKSIRDYFYQKQQSPTGDANSSITQDMIDSGVMELLNTYTQLNLADGAETEGLPLPLEDVVSKSSFAAGMSMNNNSSFDEALAALQKLIRRREAKQQQAKVSPSRSGSFFFKSAPVSPQSSEKGSPDRQEDFIDDDGSISLSRSNFNDTEEYLTGDSDLSEEEDEEDKNNLHNRATLDIYLPMPLDSMFRLLDSSRKYNRQHDKKKKQDEEESGGRHSLFRRGKKKDNHYSSKGILQPKKFPILICVNGGAWIVGCYFWNFLIARIFAARGYVVFCPDYRNFPQTTMEGMVLDVSDAIAWVLQNAERYNGDLNNVTLMGQSAGAHLTMMSLLSQAHLKATEENNKAGGGKPIAPPSSVAYNVPRYNPRQSIHRYVGLSGIYNLKGLVGHFDKRGLYRDVLYQICGGKKHLSRYTVVSYFDPRKTDSTGEAMPDNLFDFFPQQVLLVHGDADKSAPLSESANLAYLMNSAQRDALIRRQNNNNHNNNENVVPPVKVDFVLVPGASHTCAIIEEPLSCRNSHIVELLQNYNVRQVEEAKCYNTPYVVAENGCVPPHVIQSQGKSYQVSAASPSSRGKEKPFPAIEEKKKNNNNKGEDSKGGKAVVHFESPLPSARGTSYFVEKNDSSDDEGHENIIVPSRRPDGILIPPVALHDRPLLIRLGALVNPF